MRRNIYTFNNLLRAYNRYRRKLANLRKANKNQRRQHILQKHIARLFEKLTMLNTSIRKSTVAASVAIGALVFAPQTADAQVAFSAKQVNPFGLSGLSYDAAPAFADLDGDGDYDMLAATDYFYDYGSYSYVYSFKYFENIGTATNPVYASGVDNPFGITAPTTGYLTPTFVDIDGDGDMDIFYGHRNGRFYFMENTGTPTAPAFAAPVESPFGLVDIGSYSTPTFADIDGDGDFDMISGEYYGDFYYFENTGTSALPAFATPVVNPSGLTSLGSYNYSAPSLIDIDGDGDFDLLSGHDDGNFYYFENTGSSTVPAFGLVQVNPFSLTRVGSPSLRRNSKPTFIDIDNDGDMDLMAGDSNGDFNFYKRCTPSASTISPAAACSYTAPSGQTFLTTGVFTDIIPNATGCDSIITINLTIDPLADQPVSSIKPIVCGAGTTTIDLGSSQLGVNYFLRNNLNDTIVDGPIMGTGSSISFNTGNISTPTTYNVYGIGEVPTTGLVFDGNDDYVDAGTGVDLSNKSFSVEFWAKKNVLSSGNDDHIIGLGDNTTNNNALHIGFRGNNNFTFAFFGNDLDAPSNLADTDWHHWAVTYDAVSTARTIYRDGVQVANGSSPSSFLGTGNLKIGRAYNADNNYFNGVVDEVRIWTVAKTQSEIQTDMNSCLTGTETGLLAYYQFEDGTGTTLTDITPNGNDGTLQNMDPNTDWVQGSTVCSSCNLEMTQTITINVGNNSASSISPTACHSYTSPSGNYTWTTSNTYMDTIPNAVGCDSVMTINLTINTVSDLTTTTTGVSISANNTGATYQWLDCNNSFAIIPGENNQAFTATANGSYAVELTENSCVDTSACVAITTVGVIENAFGDALKVYPNPTDGEMSIDLGGNHTNASVIIRNALGQEVMRQSFNGSNILQLNVPGEVGIYFIEINADGKRATLKVLKE